MKTPDNLSQTDADELMKNVTEAQSNLVYSTRNRELAELETKKYDLVEADPYTKASYQALTAIKSEIDTLVATDKEAEIAGTERVNPKDFITKRTAFQNSMLNLVDISTLKAAIKQSESVDGTLYTNESYQSYVAAVEAGKKEFPFTTGQNQYDFVDYDIFAEQVAAVVSQSDINGIINICSGKPEKLSDRVERFIKENNYNIKLEYGAFPDRPYDSKAVWGDGKKIQEIMNK